MFLNLKETETAREGDRERVREREKIRDIKRQMNIQTF